jgi:glycosyltransferase involved in cell wall biosynthesis
MRVCYVFWGVGLAGGYRAIFEVGNRLLRRGYQVEAVALGGDHRWFNVEFPIRYVAPPRAAAGLIRAYRALKLNRKQPDMSDVLFIARKLGLHIDAMKHLSENIPGDCDVYIATYYLTALALYLSSARGRLLYFMQDFPELVSEDAGEYGLKLFQLTLKLPFDYFLANSTYSKSIIESVNPAAKVLVTYVGVDTETFRPRDEKIVDGKGKKTVMVLIRGIKFKGDDVIKGSTISTKELATLTMG